jgi:hypothetical protein
MKSMAIYSALFATVIHVTENNNEDSFSTTTWEFENQLNVAHIGSHHDLYMTHGDKKLDHDNADDEKHHAQYEISSDRVEEYAFPSICSLKLDSPV